MTHVTGLKTGKLHTPQILGDRPPVAEVVMARDAIWVTVSVPGLDRGDLDLQVTAQSIRMRSKKDPSLINFVIPLPTAVEPGRYVLRFLNGVYDFALQRASV